MVGVSFKLQKPTARKGGSARNTFGSRELKAKVSDGPSENGVLLEGNIEQQKEAEVGVPEAEQREEHFKEGTPLSGGSERPRSGSLESTQPLTSNGLSKGPPKGDKTSIKRKRNDPILKGHKSLNSLLRAARASRAPGGGFLMDELPDLPVSFAVNLLSHEFSLDHPLEKDGKLPTLKTLSKTPSYPINRATEGFLTALDRGYVPSEMISELPCAYVDGCIIVELRDYRDCQGGVERSSTGTPRGIPRPPVVHKLLLRPDTESITKEAVRIGKETKLGYQDQLELEGRALKAMQPSLCLDPNPKTLAKSAARVFSRCKMTISKRPGGLRFKGSIASRRVQAIRSLQERRTFLAELESTEEGKKEPFPAELIELSVDDLMGKPAKQSDRVPSPVAEDKPIALIRSNKKSSSTKGQRALAAAAAAVAAQKALAEKADRSAKEAESQQAKEESRALIKALDLVKEEDGRPILSGQKRKTMEEIKEERARAKKQKQEEKEQAREMRAKEKEELKEKKNQERLQKQQKKQTSATADKERRDKEVRDRVEAAERAREAEEERIEAERKQKEEQERERAIKAAKEEEERKKRERLAKEALAKIREVPKTAKQLKEEAKEREKEAKRKKKQEDKAAKEAERKRLVDEKKAKDAAALAARKVPSFSLGLVKGEPTDEIRPAGRPSDEHVAEEERKQTVDTRAVLLQLIRKHDLQPKPPKVDMLVRPNSTVASKREVQIALAQMDASKDVTDPLGYRSMANSLAGGSVNARKNRIIQFMKAEARPAPGTKGPPTMVVYKRLRLVLCGRPQDTMVQAVMQIPGDEDSEDPQTPGSGNRNIVLPVLPSQEAADAFAAELIRLLKHEGHQLYSDDIMAVGQPRHMGPPMGGINGQNRLPISAGAIAGAAGSLGPMAVPGGLRLPSPGLPIALASPTGHPPSRVFPSPASRNHLLMASARSGPSDGAQLGTPVPGSPQLGPLSHMNASQMAQRVMSSTVHGAHVGAQLVPGHPAPMPHQHPQAVLQQQLQQQQMQHRQAQQQLQAQAGVQQRHQMQQRQQQQQQQLHQMQQVQQQAQQVQHQQQTQQQMQKQLQQRQILHQQQQQQAQVQQMQRNTLQAQQRQQTVPGTPQTPPGGLNMQPAGRGGRGTPTLKQAQMLQQQQQQAKQKQMAAALARSQSGGSQQGQTLPPAQVLMGQGGETHPQIRLAQQQLVQQRIQQQYRAQQQLQQQQQQNKAQQSTSSSQLQSPPAQSGAKPPMKQQAAQLKRQLSQQQSGSQSEQSQQAMFQRQLSQNEVQSRQNLAQVGAPQQGQMTPQLQRNLSQGGAQAPQMHRAMPGRQVAAPGQSVEGGMQAGQASQQVRQMQQGQLTSPVAASNVAAQRAGTTLPTGARQVAPPQQMQRPQTGQQPQTPQGQASAQQGPENSSGSQPLTSPKVNLQRAQLQQYMRTLPPEKRQEVWQQLQARNAAARSNQAAAQVPAGGGVLSPGMQTPPQGSQTPLARGGGVSAAAGRGVPPQLGAGRGKVGPPARGRGVQLPGNPTPQSPAQLAAAAAIAQVAAANAQTQQLAGTNPQVANPNPQRTQPSDTTGLRPNPPTINPPEGLVSPAAGMQSPSAYPYNLQQAQMSALMQKPGTVASVNRLIAGQGIAPPLVGGQATPAVDTGRPPQIPGQGMQPQDK